MFYSALLAISSVGLLALSAISVCVIPSASMAPTLNIDDAIGLNKWAYEVPLPLMEGKLHVGTPARGDIVVFHAPLIADSSQSLHIKRVAAVAGDIVEVKNSQVWVNKKLSMLGEPPVYNKGSNTVPLLIPPGFVYVVGDHHQESWDSRSWGLLSVDRIVGKAYEPLTLRAQK